jgi:hypothetical protein
MSCIWKDEVAMIIPDYWDEHRDTRKISGGKKITVSRFGWSDTNQADAKSYAEKRVNEAFQQLADGQDIERREKRVSYNGSDGMPIREEIIQFHDDAVVSRNIYGALCLNTPDTLFADIDFGENHENKINNVWTWLLVLAGILQYNYIPNFLYDVSWNYFGLELQYYTYKYVNEINPGLILAVFGGICWVIIFIRNQRYNENDEQFLKASTEYNLNLIEDFSKDHRGWNIRVYRTHSGLRIMVLHDLFAPNDPLVNKFFEAVNCDPQYVAMCQLQNCFRARVSPKPWRMELEAEYIKLKGGIWPINKNKMDEREEWVSRYEKMSKDYRSCRLEKDIGSNMVHDKCERLRVVHDFYCNVDNSDLNLA